MGLIIKRIAIGFAILVASLLLFNASFLAGVPSDDLKILSHRGVHQTFHREGLTNNTCTAERIYPPTHTYIENTLPSIEAAFELGADMVEIDVRRTSDNQFAVFHDHMLECRTDAVGRIADFKMEDLRALDLGYGYTADGGKTYPLRGTGTGLMMSLDELISALPDKAFLINVKSNSAKEAEIFAAYLQAENVQINQEIQLWSGPRFAKRFNELRPSMIVGTRRSAKACARSYVMWGWTGRIPNACAEYGLIVPQNYSWVYWGWPRKTVSRFQRAGVQVLLVGPLGGENEGIESLSQFADVPHDYRGWIMTNKIEIIGPAVAERSAAGRD